MSDRRIASSARIEDGVVLGNHIVIEDNVIIRSGSVIGDHVTVSRGTQIDYRVIIRDHVTIGADSFVGTGCVLGEYLADYFTSHINGRNELTIGERSIIRSGSVIYGGTQIGTDFQTGHRVTIREKACLGDHVSVGTLSDIQGYCEIGNYVRMHSNVHIGQESRIEDYVWIFPYVVLTNDPTPPSCELKGVTLQSFAVVSTGSVLLPGVTVEGDSLVAAGAVVTKDVHEGDVVGGNPAKVISHISGIRNHVSGEPVYPWRYTFKRGMPWEESDYQTWYQSVMSQLDTDRR